MRKRPICVLGGTGFVGAALLNRLAAEGHRLRVLTRSRERNKDLWVLPGLELIEADVHDVNVLTRQFAGCGTVINLIGILNEPKDDGSGFVRAHVELVEHVLEACARTGVRRLLHMSALGAAPDAPSHYLRTKGEAEQRVLAADSLDFRVTVFRPSVVFGPHDHFFNRFASLLRFAPGVFPLACPQARMAPVFVEDVAAAFVRALALPETYGQSYDLCGPDAYSLQTLVQYTAEVLKLRRRVIPLGERLSRLQAELLEWVPGKPFSRDNYRSLQVDNVCSEAFPAVFGIVPSSVQAVVPQYLGQRRHRDRFAEFRGSYS